MGEKRLSYTRRLTSGGYCLALLIVVGLPKSALGACNYTQTQQEVASLMVSFPAHITRISALLKLCIKTTGQTYKSSPAETELKKALDPEDFERLVTALIRGEYTGEADRNILEQLKQHAGVIFSTCSRTDMYRDSLNPYQTTRGPRNNEDYINICQRHQRLSQMELTEVSGIEMAVNRDESRRRCETASENGEAPALHCARACEQYPSSESCGILARHAHGTLARSCAENPQPTNQSCIDLCNAQASSCLEGMSSVAGAGFGDPPLPGDDGANAPIDPAPGGENAGPTGGQTAVDPTGGNSNSDLTSEDGNRLAGLARNLGNMFQMQNGANFPGSNTNVPNFSPTSNLKASGNAGDGALSGQFRGDTEMGNHLPLSASLPIPTERWPRGRDPQQPGSGAPGQQGAGMGGAPFLGGGQNGPAGGGGGASSARNAGGRGGGVGRSSYAAIADSLGGNNFLGASGGGREGGNATGDRQAGQPRTQAKNRTPDERAARLKKQVGSAFRNGLPGQISQGLEPIGKGGYFPAISEVYDRLYQRREVILNDAD